MYLGAIYIPRISLPISAAKRQTNPGNIQYKSLKKYMNVEIGRQNIIFLFWK
jgi:hypothetical protein